jgi:hypothetical protein
MYTTSFFRKIKITSCCLFIGILFSNSEANAQADSALELLKTMPVKAVNFTTDNLGNLYFITANNRLEKYDAQNDTTLTYNNFQNGTLAAVDATNPLQLLLFYPDFGTIIILDRKLAFINKINLQNSGIFKPDAIATSYDNQIWVYDEQEAKLEKIDLAGNLLLQSTDLRQVLGVVPSPDILLDQGGYVYMNDPENGIFVFDHYATYKNELHYTGVQSMQFFNNQLILFHTRMITVVNLQSFAESNIKLPGSSVVLQACIQRHRLYVLTKNQLDIYRIN